MAFAPSPVIALNRAVVVAEIDGADPALRLVDAIELPQYHLLHAVRADLLRRLGRYADAATEYQTAIEQCANAVERDFLTQQYRSQRRKAGRHPASMFEAVWFERVLAKG